MKVVGIIAEYNPFHNGHKYQIEELKKQTGADYVVIAMSGDFLQRGVPAICDKYKRTQMALDSGADLVLELPVIWATASAEFFAKGGVQLLTHLGVVTHLGFGAETEQLDALHRVSSILKAETPLYQEVLAGELKMGKSFPSARKQALLATESTLSSDDLNELLDSPNNILALEYLKALPEHITPVLIQRKGSGYHDKAIDVPLPSATAIREILLQKEADIPALTKAMPKESLAVLADSLSCGALLDTEDFSSILGYRLLSLEKEGYYEYADSNPELSNKIKNQLKNYTGFKAFCQALKSKDLTYTRVSRLLLHILLDIKQTDYAFAQALDYVPYLRVLGFRQEAATLLHSIKKEAHVPLITKVADAASILSPEAYSIFEKDLYAASIYNQVLAVKNHQPPVNEYTSQIVIR